MLASSAPDDSALLELVGEVMGVLDPDELASAILAALLRAIPAKWASLNEIGPAHVKSRVEPHLDEEWFDRFAKHAEENPLYRHWQRSQDGRAYRFSDVTTRRKLESTQLFREVYRPLGINHQIAFSLPGGDGHMVGIAMHREDPDFSDAERDFLNRARPFLIQAHRNAIAHASLRGQASSLIESALGAHGLTAREAEVVRLVAFGGSNSHVAEVLGLSDRTVQKHLERAFRKLGVTTRSAAAARAWELAALG